MKKFTLLSVLLFISILSIGQNSTLISTYQTVRFYNGSYLIRNNEWINSYSLIGEFYDRVSIVNREDKYFYILGMEFRVEDKSIKDTVDSQLGKLRVRLYSVVDSDNRNGKLITLSKEGKVIRVELYTQEILGKNPKAYRTIYLFYISKIN